MITIDALLKDGRTALADLDGCSPGGGQVTTESRPRTALVPGDVVRDCGDWVVVVAVRHNGIYGTTSVDLLDHGGIARGLLMCSCDGAEVRTDTRIDPDSLWKLAADGRAASNAVVSETPAAVEPGAKGWLSRKAESYFNDARKFRDHAKIHGRPILSAEEDAHWLSVYRQIAEELHKCAVEISRA